MYVAKIDEIKAMAGPIMQKHFEKVEAERQAVQARVDAERAAKKAAEEEARKAAEADQANGAGPEAVANDANGSKDEEMPDADAPKMEVQEAD